MQVQVSGKQVDVGEALGSRISQELEDGVGKYFARGGDDAEVVVSKDGHGFKVDCWVRLASGQTLVTTGFGGDAIRPSPRRWIVSKPGCVATSVA